MAGRVCRDKVWSEEETQAMCQQVETLAWMLPVERLLMPWPHVCWWRRLVGLTLVVLAGASLHGACVSGLAGTASPRQAGDP
jgi:hypothetical protein